MSYRRDGTWRYDDKQWRKVRSLVLDRDGHLCQIRDPGCLLDATHADHIIRPADGGGRFDPENLRAACSRCNQARGGKVGAARTNRRHRRRVRPSREW